MATFTETIQLKDEASPTAKKVSSAVQDAAAAMKVGKETITAAFDGITKAAKALASGDVAGAFDGLVEGAAGAAKALDLLYPGLGQVASAAIKLLGGLGSLVIAGAQFAIASSEAKNASLALWSALGEGKITGGEVDDMLDNLRAKLGVTKEQLGPFTEEFLKMGITGTQSLEDLTTAAISAEAIVKGGGQAFASLYRNIDAAAESGSKLTIPLKKLTNQLAGLGLNIEDVGREMGMTSGALTKGLKAGTVDARAFGDALQTAVTKKGVGPLQALANSSANLGKMLQEYLGDLFEDLGDSIAPFMAAVKDLFGIIDSKANPSGQALKAGIGGFFKEVFAAATLAVPYIKHFLLDVVIFGLKAYIAIKPIAQAIKEWATSAEGASILKDVMNALYEVIIVVAYGVAAVVAVVAILWAASTLLAITLWSLVGAFISLMVDGIQAQIAAFNELGAVISAFVSGAIATLTGWVTGATTAASDFIKGLVAGITNGASQVVGAVKGLAQSALAAFTGKQGIDAHSPSLKMFKAGGFMTDGVAEGIDAGIPDVHGAATGMAQGAVGKVNDAAQTPAAAGGGASNVYNVTVSLTADSKGAEGITREMVAATFEAFALGAGV